MLIRQFEQDSDMLDDAVADWLGISRADLGSGELRNEEMTRIGQLARDEQMLRQAAPVPSPAVPAQGSTIPTPDPTTPTIPTPDPDPGALGSAGAWSLLQKLFGEPTTDSRALAHCSAAETSAFIRFFTVTHQRRTERIRRIRTFDRSGASNEVPGTTRAASLRGQDQPSVSLRPLTHH